MKTTIWDILTGIVLLGILCMVGAIGMVIANPTIPFNPLAPPPTVAPIVFPSDTPGPALMPPTWTPAPVLQPTAVDTAVPTAAPPAGLRPSSTPVPTNTPVLLPSFTPSRTLRAGVSGGACTVTYQNPTDGTQFNPRDPIDMFWTVKNNSSTTWQQDSIDVRFTGGDRFHRGPDVFDLPYDVSTGAQVDISVNMLAPSTSGSYTSNWALYQGETSVCRFFVQIRVR